ncbi:DUF4178 domain-containing protein [Streptosporangiaceae bacterium NEAU-GS5]|nr:DUF4178 domain-containing protein [Streptosporangiaceae bacterium NEAU-GS5]
MTAVVLGVSVMALALVLVAIILSVLGRRNPEAERREPPSPDAPVLAAPDADIDFFDPRTIKVGDVVHCQGVRTRAIGALHLSRQGEQWTEYLLEVGIGRYEWLSVEERGEYTLEVILWTPVPAEGMVPAKSMLILEGTEFYPVERGTLAFRSEGVTGLPDRGLLDYADYRAEGGRMLSFQRVQGAKWIAAFANPLAPGTIRVERPS